MAYYIDTSAVLPYYRNETISDKVQDFLLSLDTTPYLSSLTKVEFASALARLVRTKELDVDDANYIQQLFLQHINKPLFHVREIQAVHYALAEHWLMQRTGALRTLDALHLATASQLDSTLVTCDVALANTAKILNIEYFLIE
jgi:predicted nucleic acid-binding protein